MMICSSSMMGRADADSAAGPARIKAGARISTDIPRLPPGLRLPRPARHRITERVQRLVAWLSCAATDPDLERLAGHVRGGADHEPVLRRRECVHDRRVAGGHLGRVYFHQTEV